MCGEDKDRLPASVALDPHPLQRGPVDQKRDRPAAMPWSASLESVAWLGCPEPAPATAGSVCECGNCFERAEATKATHETCLRSIRSKRGRVSSSRGPRSRRSSWPSDSPEAGDGPASIKAMAETSVAGYAAEHSPAGQCAGAPFVAEPLVDRCKRCRRMRSRGRWCWGAAARIERRAVLGSLD